MRTLLIVILAAALSACATQPRTGIVCVPYDTAKVYAVLNSTAYYDPRWVQVTMRHMGSLIDCMQEGI